jgi:hypothetical protein
MDPSESNPFARAVGDRRPPSPAGQRARFALGLALSLLLAALLTIGLFLLGALVVRGVRRGDYRAAGAAAAVVAMTVLMALGRRRKPPSRLQKNSRARVFLQHLLVDQERSVPLLPDGQSPSGPHLCCAATPPRARRAGLAQDAPTEMSLAMRKRL